MKPTKWNTLRIAQYGAIFGAAYSAVSLAIQSDHLVSAAAAGEMVGGAFGGALLFAAASGIRNFFVQ
jgi:hypothetical protein